MTNGTASIVSKVWSFCTTLRADGVSYGDYLEQLSGDCLITFLSPIIDN
jgi:hypothetical protein